MSLPDDERAELQQYRRQSVLDQMRDLSEWCWCAGWNSGLEASLWLICFEGASPDYGMREISIEERENLRSTAERANCWYRYSDEDHGPVPITLQEARDRYRLMPSSNSDSAPGRSVQEVLELYERSGPDDWIQVEPQKSIAEAAAEPPGDGSKRRGGLDWIFRAREEHHYRADSAMTLVRRSDHRFELRYGYVDVQSVQPAWLPREFPRAPDCSADHPCKQTLSCVACAEGGNEEGGDDPADQPRL